MQTGSGAVLQSGAPLATQPPKLLDQIKRCIRDKHYSLRTEEAYVYWIKCFIRSSFIRLVHAPQMPNRQA